MLAVINVHGPRPSCPLDSAPPSASITLLCCSLLFIVGCRWIQADSTFYNPNPSGTELDDTPPALMYLQGLVLHATLPTSPQNHGRNGCSDSTMGHLSGESSSSGWIFLPAPLDYNILYGCIRELNSAHTEHGSSVDTSSSSDPNLHFHT